MENMIYSHDECPKDCVSCANAFVDDDNKLRCFVQDWKIVNDNDVCDNWN